MILAIETVKSGSTSITRAAKLHGAPRQTLKYRISDRVQHSVCPGPKPYLLSTEQQGVHTKLQKYIKWIKCLYAYTACSMIVNFQS